MKKDGLIESSLSCNFSHQTSRVVNAGCFAFNTDFENCLRIDRRKSSSGLSMLPKYAFDHWFCCIAISLLNKCGIRLPHQREAGRWQPEKAGVLSQLNISGSIHLAIFSVHIPFRSRSEGVGLRFVSDAIRHRAGCDSKAHPAYLAGQDIYRYRK